jgi:hypothetical protein
LEKCDREKKLRLRVKFVAGARRRLHQCSIVPALAELLQAFGQAVDSEVFLVQRPGEGIERHPITWIISS